MVYPISLNISPKPSTPNADFDYALNPQNIKTNQPFINFQSPTAKFDPFSDHVHLQPPQQSPTSENFFLDFPDSYYTPIGNTRTPFSPENNILSPENEHLETLQPAEIPQNNNLLLVQDGEISNRFHGDRNASDIYNGFESRDEENIFHEQMQAQNLSSSNIRKKQKNLFDIENLMGGYGILGAHEMGSSDFKTRGSSEKDDEANWDVELISEFLGEILPGRLKLDCNKSAKTFYDVFHKRK